MRRNDPCTTSSSSSSSYSGSSTSRLHVNCTRQMFALHRPCWFALHHINTMQYYTIQSNTMQRSDTTQYNATQGFKNTTQYNAMPPTYNTRECASAHICLVPFTCHPDVRTVYFQPRSSCQRLHVRTSALHGNGTRQMLALHRLCWVALRHRAPATQAITYQQQAWQYLCVLLCGIEL